jgi:UDP-N-acetylglucosamine--N-acetylmuramyl-(pentapeptide) pyrophosphoryl-undecaprenol N-acetylglucosamine transferase
MKKEIGPRVLFAGGGTGGHLYPAIALSEAVKNRYPDAEIMFVGALRGVEARVLPERELPHVLLRLEPIRRSRPWENWRLIPAFLGAVGGLQRVFRVFRPHLVVGTGGYVSGPVLAWAMLKGIPTALQEQNSYPGFVTRVLAKRARQLHLAFPEALRHLNPGPRTEVFTHGNPIVPPDASIDRRDARAHFGLGQGTVALVVGGSQGSRALNEALLADLTGVVGGKLPARPAGLEILWATGPGNFDSVRDRLAGLDVADWVHITPYINEMPKALASADVAISRAGAMALSELCAWGIPSVLIPLPSAAANHQHHNAMALVEAGAALIAPEADLESGRLWEQLRSLAADDQLRASLAAGARERGHPHAAAEIIEALSRLLGSGNSASALPHPK